jgi:putative ABC transport system permease protein
VTGRTFIRLLLALYPHEHRAVHGADFEAACVECLRRERARAGVAGSWYACVRLLVDSASAAFLVRLDLRRRRRIARAHQSSQPPGDSPMSSFWQDVVYAARGMRRAPGFTVVVVLTLALAIGATTAIFGVVNAVLLRSLPYQDPERLMMVYESLGERQAGFSAPDFTAFEQRVQSFEAIAAFRNKPYELSGVAQPEQVMGLRVSAQLFDILGVRPALGRTFTRDEDRGRQPSAILSDGLWRRAFGADPNVLSKTVVLDRRSYTIVGVMPPGFVFPNRGPVLNNVPAAIYVPISFTDSELAMFGAMYNNSAVGRLRQGVTVAAANAEARGIMTGIAREVYPASMSGWDLRASATPIRDETVGRIETTLYVLFAGVAIVLLIACADIANLMLTRMAGREREMAVRTALGAARTRIIRQVLVESSVLALAGGALGIALASVGSRLLVTLAPPTIPRTGEIGLDIRVLLFALAMSMLTAVLCGIIPAAESARRDAGDALKEGGRTGSGGPRRRRVFGALVTLQFALAIVLLAAGGLLIRSFARLLAVDPGFRVERVLTLGTSLPASAYPTGATIRSFYTRLLERVDQLPGVSAASAATFLPLSVLERRGFSIESQPPESAEIPHVIANDWVFGRYFEASGVPLKRGRYLGPDDNASAEPVVVINETMARRFWPGQDPVGQRMTWGRANPNARWLRIVGIVGDVKQGPLNSETVPQSYQPWIQLPDAWIAENVTGINRSLKVIVRTQAEPTSLANAIRAQIRELDPSLPVTAVQTMEEVIGESTRSERFNAVLLGGFAGVALLLAALGIGGVLATSVSRRTQEIGVRMALGAQRGDLLRMIVRQGMTLVIVGLALGVPAALLLTRLMASLLFQTTPHDPLTFAGVAILLVVVAAVACYVPARRATRVSPIVALRYE